MINSAELYVLVDAVPGADDVLRAVLAAAPVQCVLVRGVSGADASKDVAQAVIRTAQAGGVAALVEDETDLACELDADGVHLNGARDILARYGAARDAIGADKIVGASAGKSRHDAMMLGEAGVDYVAFGIPPMVKDAAGARARRREMITWWAQLFEVPCVGFDADDADDAADLVAAGADFVTCWLTPDQSTNAAVRIVEAYKNAVQSTVEETTA